MKIIKLDETFIFDLLDLCKSIGWLQNKAFMKKQFEMYLSLGTLVGYMHENKLIAAGGVFPFKDRFSTIGMLIVHPHFQGRGIGRILLNHCLEHTLTKQPIALIATKAGEPLYTSCGFQTITTIHRFEKQTIKTYPSHLQQVQEEDLISLTSIDQIATGVNRSLLYSLLLPRAVHSFKIERNNRIEAFSLCIQKGNILCINPLIAKQEEDAIQLLKKICECWNGIVRIDVPHSQFTFRKFLQTENFQETLLSPLMIKNGSQLPGNRNMLFAMIDTALC
ncbi:GNAT family N-acetyltransferase [Bacillus cereus group sp. MYBK71-2]|uniref:GNAT family N-acetyltransferase n=1 Tax=Bacillus TaxID=1386 RepID=UPI000B4A5742|nr:MULTISPECIES: GNAT family N-acetyltransferase [Bacillus]MCC2337603.1 GNAT family N-acetyltransferase [Bacillus tropicus]MCU5422138.1 GNAT family N-acetyltransferase [Bacillus tropicus]MDA1648056.1 GNAT family N-acetyltransferase [Bacillus cereus group sp. TH160LC]MDA1776197.1 GNAT family N-acetyltransferase [Bacillus cereus group sp. BY9-3LC]MDA1799269.1 GNAT family N-acetyltransferase [Bacillus cereus group sp. BY6-1LC]